MGVQEFSLSHVATIIVSSVLVLIKKGMKTRFSQHREECVASPQLPPNNRSISSSSCNHSNNHNSCNYSNKAATTTITVIPTAHAPTLLYPHHADFWTSLMLPSLPLRFWRTSRWWTPRESSPGRWRCTSVPTASLT